MIVILSIVGVVWLVLAGWTLAVVRAAARRPLYGPPLRLVRDSE